MKDIFTLGILWISGFLFGCVVMYTVLQHMK